MAHTYGTDVSPGAARIIDRLASTDSERAALESAARENAIAERAKFAALGLPFVTPFRVDGYNVKAVFGPYLDAIRREPRA